MSILVLDWVLGRHKGGEAFKLGGGLEKMLPKSVFDVEIKNRLVLGPDI